MFHCVEFFCFVFYSFQTAYKMTFTYSMTSLQRPYTRKLVFLVCLLPSNVAYKQNRRRQRSKRATKKKRNQCIEVERRESNKNKRKNKTKWFKWTINAASTVNGLEFQIYICIRGTFELSAFHLYIYKLIQLRITKMKLFFFFFFRLREFQLAIK